MIGIYDNDDDGDVFRRCMRVAWGS